MIRGRTTDDSGEALVKEFEKPAKRERGSGISRAKMQSGGEPTLVLLLATPPDVLFPRMVRVIEELTSDWRWLDERIEGLSGELEELARRDAGCERLMSVPGIGRSSPAPWSPRSGPATGSPRVAIAAWWDVPKQVSTGDRTILGSISKRGNRYLRVLFVQAAWVVLVKVKPNRQQHCTRLCHPQECQRAPVMLQTAARLLLLFAGGNGRYCGLAIVAEIGEGISDASHFLDAPTFGPALLFYVRAACFSSRRDLGQSCLAHVGKVCDTLLEASGNAELSRFDVSASFFDILRAGT